MAGVVACGPEPGARAQAHAKCMFLYVLVYSCAPGLYTRVPQIKNPIFPGVPPKKVGFLSKAKIKLLYEPLIASGLAGFIATVRGGAAVQGQARQFKLL